MTVKTSDVQVGLSGTATDNFVVTPGTTGQLKISRGNVGATTEDNLVIGATGKMTGTVVQSSPSDTTAGSLLVVGATKAALGADVAGTSQLLGVGQTWQDVLGSRALNVTYTNSTGKPIFVSINLSSGATTSAARLIVDTGTPYTVATVYAIQNSFTAQAYTIVPNLATYQFATVTGSPIIGGWAELR